MQNLRNAYKLLNDRLYFACWKIILENVIKHKMDMHGIMQIKLEILKTPRDILRH